jgi:hypothetical protein
MRVIVKFKDSKYYLHWFNTKKEVWTNSLDNALLFNSKTHLKKRLKECHRLLDNRTELIYL